MSERIREQGAFLLLSCFICILGATHTLYPHTSIHKFIFDFIIHISLCYTSRALIFNCLYPFLFIVESFLKTISLLFTKEKNIILCFSLFFAALWYSLYDNLHIAKLNLLGLSGRVKLVFVIIFFFVTEVFVINWFGNFCSKRICNRIWFPGFNK